ncbi:hypothetical protein QBC46DRAFT_411928 [Diplogelasinospora grovesii]|uniref:Uncharacterized protein n=1 Tax=Diplogelasinospora grovesii TaxID=303347 RepID=A0AAN6N2F4_9PEZI|nr:hypothetical protein QBC46DRAFT_411928 [Diplogelasinospora grovesii]
MTATPATPASSYALSTRFPVGASSKGVARYVMTSAMLTSECDLDFTYAANTEIVVTRDAYKESGKGLDKRDSSYIELLNCELGATKHDLKIYTVRYIYIDDSNDFNCDDIHLSGAKGTIVKLLPNCGFTTYSVMHAIKLAANDSIPHELRARAFINVAIYELSFNYNFNRIKRVTLRAPIFIHIDYNT